eukprot:c18341_g1_i1 orf=97-357(+)
MGQLNQGGGGNLLTMFEAYPLRILLVFVLHCSFFYVVEQKNFIVFGSTPRRILQQEVFHRIAAMLHCGDFPMLHDVFLWMLYSLVI